MLDNIKFLTYKKEVINAIALHPDFEFYVKTDERGKPMNWYYSLRHKTIGTKLSLHFRKAVFKGKLDGFSHLEVNMSPHYHSNGYSHNGNDFPPEKAIKTIIEIFNNLKIQTNDYQEFKVVNIEFGLNVNTEISIENLINGLIYSKKTLFQVGKDFPYFKITDATSFKKIKAYAKGLQFLDNPEYNINRDTFRFEVKTKQSKYLKDKKIRIYTANDLLKLDTYERLGQTLLDEWEEILLINLEPDLDSLKTDEVQFVKDAKDIHFWYDMMQQKYRNKFTRYKEKYYSILGVKNNLHHLVKLQIIDKLNNLQSGANSTQGNPMNTGKVINTNNLSNMINLESAPPTLNNSVCIITGIDISEQKKGSRFLREKTLKNIRNTNPDLYKSLEQKFLTENAKKETQERQFYLICKGIKNADSNPRNNRKLFEKRNYPAGQLELSF